jgi:hypothetical protein
MEEHRRRQGDAVSTEAAGQRALMAGEPGAEAAFRRAAALYRESWELAPPGAYGRLVGMLKASVIAGDAVPAARYAEAQVEDPGESATAWYARALAALVLGDDAGAGAAAARMRAAGGEAFARAADAIAALAARDRAAYAAAVGDIVTDFEARDAHLTGVPIADTALMLERLAAARGLAAGVRSPLLPE